MNNRAAKRFPWRISGFMLLALLCCPALLAVSLGGCKDVSADNPEARLTVTAFIDKECRTHPGKFEVPDGKTAHDFKSNGLTPGQACHDSGAPENKGFAVRDSKNKPLYMWSQYKDQPPYEKGGPLSGLSLSPGQYTLTVAGGAGAKVELSYKLK